MNYFVTLYCGLEKNGKRISFKSSVSDISSYTNDTSFMSAQATTNKHNTHNRINYYHDFKTDIPSPVYATKEEKNIRKQLSKFQTLKDTLDQSSDEYTSKYAEYIQQITQLKLQLRNLSYEQFDEFQYIQNIQKQLKTIENTYLQTNKNDKNTIDDLIKKYNIYQTII